MSNRYLAAVDMGGTKAEGVVFKEDGEVVFRAVEKGGAPFDNGVDYSIANLCKCIDGLITNFHLPVSTLIMLVSAFAGYENTMNAYKVAVDEKYRFFSFGDAMFITDLD